QPARDALDAAGYGNLDDEAAVEKIADWLLEATENNRLTNSENSVAQDWEDWGGVAMMLDVYADGPSAEQWTGTDLFSHAEIVDAVTRLIESDYERRIAEEAAEASDAA